MKTLLLSVALFLFLSGPSNSFGQSSEVVSMLTDLIGDSIIDLPENFHCDKSITVQLLIESSDSLSNGSKYILRYPETGNFMIMMPADHNNSAGTGKSEMVIDFEKMQMITFLKTGSAKVAVVMPVEPTQIADVKSVTQKYGKLTKSGRTKMVSGHHVEEYRFDTDSATGSLWIGHDINLGITKSFAEIGLEFLPPENPSKGMIVEINSVDKITGNHTKMSMLNVSLSDSYALKTEGYIPTKLAEALGE